MKPENSSSGGNLTNSTPTTNNQTAAANVIRSQIDALYGDSVTASPQPQAQPQAQTHQQPQTYAQQAAHQDINPYDRTHTVHTEPQADQWKQYHSAWQTYYQKYYEGYYAAQKVVAPAESRPTSIQPGEAIGSNANNFFAHQTDLEATTEELNTDQA
jgi:hypothetical protein